ncbi:uncharacterized protein C9orf85 homolog [Euwallacea similis]|uniref:uncharacterized protein C9orf85 homolog n=1 Tax=Euwallacea similis TaxID=1736056 RepID=UPI00344F6489
MSTQKGNATRSRPQKYKNRTAFKNNLHDTSQQTKGINATRVSEVCQRCKEIIEWKIKYKKYKPLTQPKKCVKCDNKSVKRAYHIMCDPCGQKLGVCSKCGQSKEIIHTPPTQQEQFQLDEEMKQLLKSLPERKRRTFIRFLNKSRVDPVDADKESRAEEILKKLNDLKIEENSEDDYDYDSDDD